MPSNHLILCHSLLLLPSIFPRIGIFFSSVQFSHLVVSDSLQPNGLQYQASLSITNSWNLLKFMSIESVMPSNHLILCHSLLPLPSILPSLRVFSNKSAFHIRCPKYWSFSLCRITPWDKLSPPTYLVGTAARSHCPETSSPWPLLHSLWPLPSRPAQGPSTKMHWLLAHKDHALYGFRMIRMACVPDKH